MSTVGIRRIVLAGAIVCVGVLGAAGLAMASVGARPAVGARLAVVTSTDPSQVPVRPDISVAQLAPSSNYVPVSAAVTAAEQSFGITDSDIVRAVEVSVTASDGIAAHASEPAWVVIADYNTPTSYAGVSWRELCVVVDARSGQYQYAYPTDLNQQALASALSHQQLRSGHAGRLKGLPGFP
jgi:hypothetical protein